MHLLLLCAFLSTFAVATTLSESYTALLQSGTINTVGPAGNAWQQWEYEALVSADTFPSSDTTRCSLDNFEAFDMLPPSTARNRAWSATDGFFADLTPALSMQLRTTSWSSASTWQDQKKAWASIAWETNTSAALKQAVNYFSFASRALPKLIGTTKGQVALPPLPTAVESFLIGFWYRPGPSGAGEDAMLYTYGSYSSSNSLSHGFSLSATEGANVQVNTQNQLTKPGQLELSACIPVGTATRCKSTMWTIPDETSIQRYGPWMHIIVGVEGQGNALLFLDGDYVPSKCRVPITAQMCTQLSSNDKCASYTCASSCEVALSVGATSDIPSICTQVSTFTAFTLGFYNGLNLPELYFPKKCTGLESGGDVCFHEAGISVLRAGPKKRILNAVRFLTAPDVADGNGVKLVSADGWFHDPVAMLIPATTSGLSSTVSNVRKHKGAYVFVEHRVTDGSGFTGGTPSAITSANQISAALEGKLLVESSYPPTGLSHFPTAPISCTSMPHAAHMCAREASITYFEDACFKTHDSQLPTCGYACLFDFDNDGEVTNADLDELAKEDSTTLFIGYPDRKTDTNGDGTFNSADVAHVKNWLEHASLTAGNKICNEHFVKKTSDGGYILSGHAVGKVSPMARDWEKGGSRPSLFDGNVVETDNLAPAYPHTMCVASVRDSSAGKGVAYGPDHINGKDASDQSKCMSDLSADQSIKLVYASERAFHSFGRVQDQCELEACSHTPPTIACATLEKAKLTRDYEAPAATSGGGRRHLSTPASTVASAATTETLTMPATTSKSARRSLLRSSTRQLTANSPPPASPPSPPPIHPTLPSYEEWIEIISASFNGHFPAGVILVLNGLMAVMSITLFQPLEDLVDAFKEVLKADYRVRRALCAYGFTSMCKA